MPKRLTSLVLCAASLTLIASACRVAATGFVRLAQQYDLARVGARTGATGEAETGTELLAIA